MKKVKRNTEHEFNKVLAYQDKQLHETQKQRDSIMDFDTSDAERILLERGYDLPKKGTSSIQLDKRDVVVVRPWNEVLDEAEQFVKGNCEIESLFTEEELATNKEAIRLLNEEFNQVHHLDKMDAAIGTLAGIVGAAVDILMVGIPKMTSEGLKAGPLSNYIRDYFDKKFPEEEMQKLANSKESKVPYDAQDNRNTKIYVDGLSAYYHRLLSLGHDPVLGFIFGVADILNGTMTTIDKSGKIVTQVMKNYSDRKEIEIFKALAKQIAHFKSDVTTSMGLPAPFMSLFNLLQFGDIGECDQTIAEIVQGMYYEGYDFVHFCSMSISTMLVEVIVRLGYSFKRIGEGYSIKESIPFSLNRRKHPKLATMLFLGHSVATATNTGKIVFTQSPMAINYPQWIAFTRYSYSQLKWAIIEKPAIRDAYVHGKVNEELSEVYKQVNKTFEEYTKDKIVIYS